MPKVLIDGILYVPAHTVVVNSTLLKRALLAAWYGDTSDLSDVKIEELCDTTRIGLSQMFRDSSPSINQFVEGLASYDTP